MKFIKNPLIIAKKRQLNHIFIIGLFLVSFLAGRQSITLKTTHKPSRVYLADSSILNDHSYLINYYYLIGENLTDKVYRCGKSMIYHPTKAHASFKRCKSGIYELTVEKAKKLGMRRCKCTNYTN